MNYVTKDLPKALEYLWLSTVSIVRTTMMEGNYKQDEV